MAVMVLAGMAAAALVGAATLPGWFDQLPENRATLALGDAARDWERAMDRIGLTLPYARLRATVRWAEARKFPAPGEGSAAEETPEGGRTP